VLLEAAASGRAIVTTDVPGCRDIVRDGDNGYLCAPRDAGALAQALERAAATDDAVWQRMALAGRARVIAEFSQDRVDGIYLAALTAAGVALPDPMPNPA
jgi:glycosyltransferase involved in cell wall biosynthesis